MEPKKIGILFSGGLDSTYLMWKALEEGHNVYPYYITLENNENKVVVEKQQIDLLISKFNKNYPNKYVSLHNIANLDIFKSWNLSFAQPFIWATLCNVIGDSVDEIQIGYVHGDDAIGSISDIKKLYKSVRPFIKYQPPLKFPITKVFKEEITDELPIEYQKLITSCENPKLLPYGIKRKNGDKYRFFEPCGFCIPCKKTISNGFYRSEEIKKNYFHAEKRYNENQYYIFKEKIKRDKYNNKEFTKKYVENDILLAK